jgi:hypothetical protein
VTAGLNELQARAGVRFFDYQVQALTAAAALPGPSQRVCLYYKTGAGKSLTALSCVSLWGHVAAYVIAPPSTHSQWITLGKTLGVEIEAMSHAKFRMKTTKLNRHTPVIADEMHMFGGHGGQGWKKLEQLARGLQAPLVLASATPNYNDADRVYCIQKILDPASVKGGFLEFLYQNCKTEQNPFGMTPNVTGFLRYPDAAAYLADLPGVEYLPDDLVYTIDDITIPAFVPSELATYGYNRRDHRMIASQIEERHTLVNLGLVDDDGYLRDYVYDVLADLAGKATTPVLVYANHATVAQALAWSLASAGVNHGIVTGKTTKAVKDEVIQAFKDEKLDVLVGTASLATGTDGLDKMCDCLVILDDTDDDSLRRQLIGRIMPRGGDTDTSRKQVYRLLQQ